MHWWRLDRFVNAASRTGDEAVSPLAASIRAMRQIFAACRAGARNRFLRDYLALAELMRAESGQWNGDTEDPIDSALAHALWSIFVNPAA
jgi:hypothetical protein